MKDLDRIIIENRQYLSNALVPKLFWLLTVIIIYQLLDISCDPVWILGDRMWGSDPEVEKTNIDGMH